MTGPFDTVKPYYTRVLTIAGSDSGGGAGIQADLKTFSALGCYGTTVITALTAQNTCGVEAVSAVPAAFVAQQLSAVLDDIGTDAVKIGMLHSAEAIDVVASRLAVNNVGPIVLDPVMVASSGGRRLLANEAMQLLIRKILPLVTLLTPNLDETARLVGYAIDRPGLRRRAARDLAQFGCAHVLIKGGHLPGALSPDLLYLADQDRFSEFAGKRIDTSNDHGTGCTLGAAIAAHLAKGYPIEQAVRLSKAYLQEALRQGAGYRLGSGRGPLHHFFAHWH
jgi:hydroxymethylpyrimidine/phosphomethylpyrimidine kinase